ncbi:MAG: hypothetical protein AAGF32_00790 [Pseudomonadota bacterium]
MERFDKTARNYRPNFVAPEGLPSQRAAVDEDGGGYLQRAQDWPAVGEDARIRIVERHSNEAITLGATPVQPVIERDKVQTGVPQRAQLRMHDLGPHIMQTALQRSRHRVKDGVIEQDTAACFYHRADALGV